MNGKSRDTEKANGQSRDINGIKGKTKQHRKQTRWAKNEDDPEYLRRI